MAKKSFLRFTFDSPVTIVLAVVSAVLLVLDTFVFKGIMDFLTCPASKAFGTASAFNFASPLDYLKIILHIFGSAGWTSFFTGVLLLLAFGPVLEERYGSVMVSLMLVTAAVVNGVLTACLSAVPSVGLESLVFTMLFLTLINAFTKKVFPLSSVLILAAAISYDCYMLSLSVKDIQIVAAVGIDAASGLCASLLAYMVAPKKKASRSSSKETVREEKTFYRKPASSSSDETVVGEISL